VPPAVIAADYRQLLEPVKAQLSVAALELLRNDVEKHRSKEANNTEVLRHTLWESLSIEMIKKKLRHADFDLADLKQDTNQCSKDHHQRDSSQGIT
jgi:aspartate oxidase